MLQNKTSVFLASVCAKKAHHRPSEGQEPLEPTNKKMIFHAEQPDPS